MPITKSAIKALKQSQSRRVRNATKKRNLKEAVKGTKSAKEFEKAQSVIDKAAKTGYIHKNKAARLKSRLAKKIATGMPVPKSKKK
jgi:small subunit ribosomal protein S20